MIPQLFVAGLGNLPFPATRHSAGHLLVDALASRFGIKLVSTKGGLTGHRQVTIGDTEVALTLFKSKSLMNISGPSIAAAYRSAVASPHEMIVITDSLYHDVEHLSVKLGGSPNGHNGLKSIISALGGETDFYRFRIGIGRGSTDAADYVMGKLSAHERQFWQGKGLDRVIKEMESITRRNID